MTNKFKLNKQNKTKQAPIQEHNTIIKPTHTPKKQKQNTKKKQKTTKQQSMY